MKKLIKIICYILFYAFCFGFGFFFMYGFEHYFPYEYNYYNYKIRKGIDLKKVKFDKKNAYTRDLNFDYVQKTDSLYSTNIQDSKNIFYTFVDSGETEINFLCDKKYEKCISDMHDMIYDDDKKIINYIYHYIHPYNDYKTVSMVGNEKTGMIHLKITREYTNAEIKEINEKVDELYDILVDPNDEVRNNIKRVHDYLIDNIDYIKEEEDRDIQKNKKNKTYDTAYGALLRGKAICGGYTDAMFLFLDKMGLVSMRLGSKTHIWNVVKIDGKWYHLDVTWDDGKYTNGKHFTSYKYYLIDTDELFSLNIDSHDFNQDVFSEFKATK